MGALLPNRVTLTGSQADVAATPSCSMRGIEAEILTRVGVWREDDLFDLLRADSLPCFSEVLGSDGLRLTILNIFTQFILYKKDRI